MPRPSRIIFHYFHDTLFKLQLFSIPTLFSRFFIYPSSRVFLLFPSRLFRASTFSSYSTTLSPTGFPYPFFLLSRPYLTLFIIFRSGIHPKIPPIREFSLFSRSFSSRASRFVQPNYPRSIILCRFHIQISNFIVSNLPNIDKSRRSNFQFFKFSNFHLNSPEFPNHYLLISFPIPFPFVRKNTRRLKKSSPSDGWKRSRIISRAKPLLHSLFCSNQHG